jgi:hypothetical protein
MKKFLDRLTIEECKKFFPFYLEGIFTLGLLLPLTQYSIVDEGRMGSRSG